VYPYQGPFSVAYERGFTAYVYEKRTSTKIIDAEKIEKPPCGVANGPTK